MPDGESSRFSLTDTSCTGTNHDCYPRESNGNFYFYLYVKTSTGSSENNFDIRVGPKDVNRTPSTNATGDYYENLVIGAAVKLQGVGTGGFQGSGTTATYVPGSPPKIYVMGGTDDKDIDIFTYDNSNVNGVGAWLGSGWPQMNTKRVGHAPHALVDVL